jgi:phosphomannomutase
VDEGRQVTGVGMVSTPLLHYAQMTEKCDGAIMVTASHNPRQYQGMKLFDGAGGSVSYAKGLDRVEAMVGALDAGEPRKTGGSARERDPLPSYLDFVCGVLGSARPRSRVVIDVSSGSAGRVFRELAARLGLAATLLNEAPDGRFPSHSPNPLEEESLRDAASAVQREGADLGVILDGDGDRLLFVDEQGQRIENYFMSAVIAEELLSAAPGSAVVYDLISSRALPERIAELGGKAVVSRVGYTFLYDKMVETRAVFGSETSGHVYFRVTDRYYTESAAYALALVLRLLERRRQPLSRLVDPLRARYVQMPETNLEVKDKDKALRTIESSFAGGSIDRLDGVSVTYPDFWFNVRPSNTEPVLRLRLEAKDRATADRRGGEIAKLLASC